MSGRLPEEGRFHTVDLTNDPTRVSSGAGVQSPVRRHSVGRRVSCDHPLSVPCRGDGWSPLVIVLSTVISRHVNFYRTPPEVGPAPSGVCLRSTVTGDTCTVFVQRWSSSVNPWRPNRQEKGQIWSF